MRHAGTRHSFVNAFSIASVVTLATLAAHAAPAPGAAAGATLPAKPLADACPAQLPVSQSVVEPVAGWTALDQQGSHPFVRVAFYPGPPPESSLIVPTVEYRGQAGLHDRWELPHRSGGYWMTCAYGNTTATLARKLADDVDFCLADYDGRFLTLVVRHWACGPRRMLAPAAYGRPASRPIKPASRAANRRGE